MSHELHLKYRPKTVEEIVGQPAAVAVMRKWGENPPHVVLFHGPSGTGKTTAAYALMSALGVTKENHNLNFVNCANETGIDNVRKIAAQMEYRGLGKRVKGKDPKRGWIWDEAHLLSSQAMSGMLTELENMPDHAYFVFCTTHPHKMIPTLRGRCTQVEMKAVPPAALGELIDRVSRAEKPKVPLTSKVRAKIVELAGGCARKVLVDLGKVLPLVKEDQRLNALSSIQAEKQAIDLARLLMKKPTWAECANLLKEITEPPESIRRVVIEYACSVLSNGVRNKMAESMIEAFADNYYDSERGGLFLSCLSLCR